MNTILSIVPYSIFPAKLGGQKGIALFNEYLAKECQLICVTVKANDPGYAKGYSIRNIFSNKAFRYINPLYYFKLRKIIRQNRVQYLILEHPYFGWMGMLLKKISGINLIVHCHNIESTRWKDLGKWWWRILWRYEKKTLKAADAVFFKTEADKLYAQEEYDIPPECCSVITYGIEKEQAPGLEEKMNCKKRLQEIHGIAPEDMLILFNGTLSYKPNFDAVNVILEKINPQLLGANIKYKIIICGKGLPAEMRGLKSYSEKHIIYAGFVDDIEVYFKGVDLFINPVIEGGGIKTKLVEALGYNSPVISTESGSIGVGQEETGSMLKQVKDGDWDAFTQAIKDQLLAPKLNITDAFFKKFYWGNIAKKAIHAIEQLKSRRIPD